MEKFRILIVEDEEIEARAFIKMLRKNREDIEEIKHEKNGIDALNIFKEYNPNLVFMDINIPGINGLETIRRMKDILDDPKYIVISAYNEFDYAQEGLRLGINDYLVKPIKIKDINTIMDSIISNEIIKTKKEKLDNVLIDITNKEEERELARELLAQTLYGNNEEIKNVLDHYKDYLNALEPDEESRCLKRAFITVCNGLPIAVLNNAKKTIDEINSCTDTAKVKTLLIESLENIASTISNHENYSDNRIVELIEQIVKCDYSKDLSLDSLAKRLNYSVFYLTKMFKNEKGITFLEYLTEYRINKAKELLLSDNVSIKEVAYGVGFHSQSYFSKTFKKYAGCSPIEWIERRG